MNVPLRAPTSAPRRTWPGLLVQMAIVLVVAAVAAATFVVSYAGVHAIALQSGVPAELARLYPAIFDAVLVIGCLVVPALRGARWWTQAYTWLVIFLIVAVLAAMDVVHATSVTLPRRETAGVVAALPWALLLLAFSLWLAVLRHFRAQQSRLAASVAGEDAPIDPAQAPAAAEFPAPTEAAGAEGAAIAGASAEDPATTRQDLPALPAVGMPPAEEPRSADVGPLDALLNGRSADREEPAPDDAEVPAIAYSTGPRLRRVRSLPAPPVGDE